MSLSEQARIGVEAKRLLDDPTLTKAFQDVETAIHHRWASCPLRDKDGQYELRLMLKLLGDVRANLEQAVSDGKLATEELKITQQRQSPIEKLRSAFR